MAEEENQNLESQVNLQNEINKILGKRQRIVDNVNRSLGEQAGLANSLKDIFEKASKQNENSAQNVSNLHEALKNAAESATETADATAPISENLSKAAKEQKKLQERMTKSLEEAKSLKEIFESIKEVKPFEGLAEKIEGTTAASKMLKGSLAALSIGDIVANVSSTASMVVNIWKGALGAVFNIGRGIFGAISAGMKMLDDAAAKSHGGGANPITQAWEEVKKTISTVGPEFSKIGTAMKDLGMKGATIKTMFGRGRQGIANAIKYTGQMATEFGHTFTKVASDFAKNVNSYVLANKAIGISTEAMSNMQLIAMHRGENLSDMLKRQAKQVVHLSRTFGINAKLIGKNMDEMGKDYSTFGGLSSDAFASTAAYASKLGIAIKDLQSLTSKTDSFEGAADAAAGLASTFGMAVDTMELMNADPAEKAEMIRQSFLDTGRSFEDMSRQEKARMADLAGISQESLAGMFDPAAQDATLDDFNSASKAASKNAVTQSEANLVLAKSINRVVEAMGGSHPALGHGGPIQAFLAGVARGITTTPEFIRLIKQLKKTTMALFHAGIDAGRAIVAYFPGFGEFLMALGDFFDPVRWGKFLNKAIPAFKQFLSDLADPSKAKDAVSNFFDSLTSAWGANFDGMGDKIRKSVNKMIGGLATLIVSLTPWVVKQLSDFMKDVANVLSNQAPDDPNSIGGALVKAIEKVGPVLEDAFYTLVWQGIKSLGKIILNNKWNFVKYFAGPFFAGLAWALAKGALIFYLKTRLLKKLMKEEISSITEAAQEGAKNAPTAKDNKKVTSSLKSAIEGLREIGYRDIGKALVIGAALVVFIGVAIVGIAAALWVASKFLKNVSFEDIAKSFISLGVTLLAMWATIKITKGMSVGDIAEAGLKLVAATFFIGVSMIGFAVALKVSQSLMQGIAWTNIAKSLAGLAIVVLGTIGLAKLGKFIQIPLLVKAGLGLVAGAAFFGVVSLVFAGAIRLMMWAYGDTKFDAVVEVLKGIGVVIASLLLLMPAGLGLSAAIPVMLAATPGLIAAAAFFATVTGSFAIAMEEVYTKFSGIDLNRINEILETLKSTLSAIAALGALGAAAAFLKSFGLLDKITEGAGLAAIFFQNVSGKFANALNNVLSKFASIDINRVERVLNTMKTTLKLIAGMSVVAAAFRAFKRVIGLLKEGVAAATDFAITSFSSIANIIKEIEKIPVADPARLESVMKSITGVLVAVQKVADIGMDMAKMGIASSIFGGPDLKTMVKHSNSFMLASVGAIGSLITVMVAQASKFTNKEVKGAAAIGNMLGSVASLVSAIQGPVQNLTKDRGVIGNILAAFNGGMTKQICELVKGMTDLMKGVTGDIADLVKAMFKALKGAGTGPGVTEKAQAFGILMSSVFRLIEMQGEIFQNFFDGGNQIPMDAYKDSITLLIGQVTGIMEWWASEEGGSKMATALNAAAAVRLRRNKVRAFTSIFDNVKILSEKAVTNLNYIWNESGIKEWDETFSGHVLDHVTGVVEAYNDMSQQLNNLSPINIDTVIDNINSNLNVQRRNIKIEDGNVNITLNVGVVMSAEQLAYVMVTKKHVTVGSDAPSASAAPPRYNPSGGGG